MLCHHIKSQTNTDNIQAMVTPTFAILIPDGVVGLLKSILRLLACSLRRQAYLAIVSNFAACLKRRISFLEYENNLLDYLTLSSHLAGQCSSITQDNPFRLEKSINSTMLATCNLVIKRDL